MTLQEKIEMLEEVMDVEEGVLTVDSVISEIEEWDSLSTLSLTVEMKKRFGKDLTAEQIKQFKTVGDICEYISE